METTDGAAVCRAHERGGAPCDQPAVAGKRVCYTHGGAPGSGAPMGNQNRLKHGLYSRMASAEARQRIEDLLTVEGLANEIAYVRARVERLIEEGADTDTIDKGLVMLARLTQAQKAIRKEKRVNQSEILAEVIERLGGQTGLWELMSEEG